MKLEAKHEDQTYEIEIRPAAEHRFEIVLHGPDGRSRSQLINVLNRRGDRWTLEVDGTIEDLVISKNGSVRFVDWKSRTFDVEVYSLREKLRRQTSRQDVSGAVALRAQMPGKVISVLKENGDAVKAGEGLVVIESMKMQNELRSPKSGRVVRCQVEDGIIVNAGDLLFEVE